MSGAHRIIAPCLASQDSILPWPADGALDVLRQTDRAVDGA